MHRSAVLFLALSFVSSLGAADALYKWVDAQGVVHYSDKPQPGATKMVIPKAQTFTPPQAAAVTSDAQPAADRKPAAGLQGAILISSPHDQDTIWDVTSVTVNVALDQALQSGDTLTIALDGNSKTTQATSATFDDLGRGQHTITAKVARQDGTSQTAPPVTFYIQRATQKKPP